MTGQKVIMVSLDLSTKVSGFAVWENGKYKESFIVDFSNEKDVQKRIDKMCRELWSKLSAYSPTVVYAEDTYCGNPSAQKKLNLIQGAVYTWCLVHCKEFNLLMPSAWRKYIPVFPNSRKTNRSEKKNFSMNYFINKYGRIPSSDDESDAVCIGEAAIRMFNE